MRNSSVPNKVIYIYLSLSLCFFLGGGVILVHASYDCFLEIDQSNILHLRPVALLQVSYFCNVNALLARAQHSMLALEEAGIAKPKEKKPESGV